MGLPPVSFTGFSKFSESFDEILARTFEAASVPIQRLETERQALVERQKQIESLSATFVDLDKAFRNLATITGSGALEGTSTNEAVATVAVTGLPEKLSFTVDVTTAASEAQEASLNALASKTSESLSALGDGQFSLTVGATVTNIGLQAIGAGRTAGASGAATPAPPVSVQVDFSNGLTGSITAELNSFFVAGAAPATVGAGDTVTVNFLSSDLSINESIVSVPLAGAESAAEIATLLNDQIALNAELAGKVSFSDEGGSLKLAVSDTAGQGFSFTSSSTGATVSGLEPGGTAGGHSAEEIAAALNAQVALNAELTSAGVTFAAVNGEVTAGGDSAFDITVTDSAQGTGFVSGLAGAHSVAGFPDTLEGLHDFINAQSAELGIRATIINTSSDSAAPAYRLTLTANATGENTLRLQDSGGTDLLTAGNQGTNAVFEVNGVQVSNSGNTIKDFIPGLDLTITGPGTATVSTATDTTGVSNALSELVEAYNTAAGAIQAQVGKRAGVLSGSVEVRQAQQTLRQITSFFSSEGLNSMREIGLDLQSNGQLQFNAFTFGFLSQGTLQDALAFIGDLGSGFAGNATKLLGNLTSPTSGQFQTAIDFIERSDDKLTDGIEEAQERLDHMILTLEARFAAADLLLTQLQGQQETLTAFLDAQKLASRN
ncbi:MAG: flagellar filament capping protein FliD [Bryobacterales bacterium]